MMSLILMLLLGAGPLASASDHDHQHQAAEEGGHGADEEGLALSAEATARFGIEVKELKGPGPWLLPSSAALQTGVEDNLFRRRNGRYARVDYTAKPAGAGGISVTSPELRAGDAVVTRGQGFLRIAEISAAGGEAPGHHH
jgi:hypothetical protein